MLTGTRLTTLTLWVWRRLQSPCTSRPWGPLVPAAELLSAPIRMALGSSPLDLASVPEVVGSTTLTVNAPVMTKMRGVAGELDTLPSHKQTSMPGRLTPRWALRVALIRRPLGRSFFALRARQQVGEEVETENGVVLVSAQLRQQEPNLQCLEEVNVFAKSSALRKALIGLGVVTLIVVGTLLLVRWMVVSSDAYGIGVEALRSSLPLAERTGAIKSVRLAPIAHISFEETEIGGKHSGNAEFTLVVDGQVRTEQLKMRLVRTQHSWEVVSATYPDGTFLESINRPQR